MTVGLQDSAIFGPLFADADIAGHFSDAERVRAMLDVEAALAGAEGRLGVIPPDAADAIVGAARAASPDPASLQAGTLSAGVPVAALVAQLRTAVGGQAAHYVHWGATSQDIVDTALVICLRAVIERLDTQLAALADRLAVVAEVHRDTVMVARTRSQQALPTTFGLKAAGWLAPLLRHRDRLAELRPRVLVLQFGGAAGTLAALHTQGIAVMDAMAADLELGVAPLPWHTQRDAVVELAGWLSLLTGSLGKFGQDVVLLAQSEVSEVREGTGDAGGGSSTMPQKANPIAGETLVALARFNAGLIANMHHAAIQEHERGGPGWQVEWLTLPQMAVAAGAALKHARTLADGLVVDSARMRANIDASSGLILAEAAIFALADHMPRPDAQALVEAACADAAATGRHLMDVLAETTTAAVDWQALRDPTRYLGAAGAFIDRTLAAAGVRSAG